MPNDMPMTEAKYISKPQSLYWNWFNSSFKLGIRLSIKANFKSYKFSNKNTEPKQLYQI